MHSLRLLRRRRLAGTDRPHWLIGDHLDREVSWKGETDLGHEGEGPISLGFRMRCAKLYSVEFK